VFLVETFFSFLCFVLFSSLTAPGSRYASPFFEPEFFWSVSPDQFPPPNRGLAPRVPPFCLFTYCFFLLFEPGVRIRPVPFSPPRPLPLFNATPPFSPGRGACTQCLRRSPHPIVWNGRFPWINGQRATVLSWKSWRGSLLFSAFFEHLCWGPCPSRAPCCAAPLLTVVLWGVFFPFFSSAPQIAVVPCPYLFPRHFLPTNPSSTGRDPPQKFPDFRSFSQAFLEFSD